MKMIVVKARYKGTALQIVENRIAPDLRKSLVVGSGKKDSTALDHHSFYLERLVPEGDNVTVVVYLLDRITHHNNIRR